MSSIVSHFADVEHNEFLKYIGLDDLLMKEILFEGKRTQIKDAVRNGLVHRYFMKAEKGIMAMITTNAEASRLGFLIKEPGHLAMVVVPYFKLFCAGLQKARDQGRLK